MTSPRHIRLMTYLAVTGWFTTSIGLSNINKWLFAREQFCYPVFLTMLHMFSASLFGSVVLRYTPLGAAFGTGNARLQIPPNLIHRILVLSVVFTFSIVLGNIALRHLYISFLRMVFALSPLVTVLIARLLFNQPIHLFVYLSMVPLCFGSMLSITGEINFSMYGFLAAVGATLLRALKSILQGVLLKEQKLDTIRLLYHMSIPSSVLLLGAALLFEPSAFTAVTPLWQSTSPDYHLCLLVLASCLCSVGYNVTTFLVTFYTSPVALQVLGNVGIVLDIVVSLLVFRNEVSLLSMSGILCVMLGTWMYQQAKTVQ